MSDMSPPPPHTHTTDDHDPAGIADALPDGARAFWFLGESNGSSQEVIVLVTCKGETSEVFPSLSTMRNKLGESVQAFITGVNGMPSLSGDGDFDCAQKKYGIDLPKEMRPQLGERIHSIMARCLIENLPAHLNPQSLPLGSDGR